MGVKCVFYDCVGPLLVKNPKVILNPQIAEIDQMCGSATNEEEFWRSVESKFKISSSDRDLVASTIADSYMKNEPMWQYHESIRHKFRTAVINNGTFTIFNKWIQKYDMASHFDKLFNSSILGVRKPDRRIFEVCTSEMGVNLRESLLIDDSQYNIDGSIATGMRGIFYQPLNHSEFINSVNKVVKVS